MKKKNNLSNGARHNGEFLVQYPGTRSQLKPPQSCCSSMAKWFANTQCHQILLCPPANSLIMTERRRPMAKSIGDPCAYWEAIRGWPGGKEVRGSVSQWHHGNTFFFLFICFLQGKGGRGRRRLSGSSHRGGGTVSTVDGRRFIVATCVINIPFKRGWVWRLIVWVCFWVVFSKLKLVRMGHGQTLAILNLKYIWMCRFCRLDWFGRINTHHTGSHTRWPWRGWCQSTKTVSLRISLLYSMLPWLLDSLGSFFLLLLICD